MAKFHVTNIDWCISVEDCDNDPQIADDILSQLPCECDIECDSEDDIAMALSDKFDYLVDRFSVN